MKRGLPFVALALLAAGCGGGGSSSGVPATLAPVTAPGGGGGSVTASASVQITIPPAVTTASTRRAAYVSPATQSLAFAPATGSPIVVPLTPTSPGCSNATGPTVCTVSVPLPIGTSETFTVSTYASANGSGTALAVSTVTANIVAGQANPISLTLGGVPKTVTVSAPTTTIPTVAATAIPVVVTVKDASGNTIVGSAPFSDANGNPVSIALANSDTSGGTTLSPAVLTAPSAVTLNYDSYFQPTTATITASGTGLTAATATLTFAAKPVAYMYVGTLTPTLTANSGIESLKTSRHALATRRSPQVPGGQSLAALLPTGTASTPYRLGTNYSAAPTAFADIYADPFGMATASTGHLYFTDQTTQFGLFDAGTTPAWPAASGIIGGSSSQQFGPLALGPGGKVYAAVNGGFEQINPVTGAVIGTPAAVPTSQFQSTMPNAIAVGPDGTVYIEAFLNSSGGDEVLAFSPSGTGFVFVRALWTGNSHESNDAIYGLAVDAANHLYISSDYYGTLDVVTASASGNVLPAMVYTNNTNIDDGLNVAVDRSGNILWTTYSTLSIYGPNSGSVPPGNTNPANPWYPATDTPALQSVYGATGGDTFVTMTFGPGF